MKDSRWLVYAKFIPASGQLKFGFVGLNRTTGNITTFHIKSLRELVKKSGGIFK